jgi:DNA polymerase-3 subunit delta'
MKFSDVIGQKELGARLRKGVRESRVPHAQLFLGEEGSGNLALALAYAAYIQCQDRTEDDSCGVCSSCRKQNGMVHPDMHYSFPFPSNKADIASELYPEWRKEIPTQPYLNYEMWMQALESENKQGNIPIKECHAIIKSLALKPFEAEYKILLMWLPEFLGNEGNVLLKLMEEPPERTVFLLVGQNVDKILTTILSRVQLIRVPPVNEEDIAAALTAGTALSGEDAARVALLSAGNYLKALELARNEENRYLEPFRNWMGYCYQKKMGNAVQWADDYSGNGREQLKGFFMYCLEIMRAVLVHPYTPEKSGLSSEESEFVGKFSKIMDTHVKGEKMYNWFNEAAFEVERNGNAKIILTDLSFKVARLLK